MQILKVTDEAFRQYGKVIKDLDVSDIITAMSETPCPDDVVYEPSIESLEACKSAQSVSDSLYGVRRLSDERVRRHAGAARHVLGAQYKA